MCDKCSSLLSVVIPSSVKEIKDGAFYGCTSLNSVLIPKSVKKIGNDAFSCCESLTISGFPDSYAQQFANERGIKFLAL